MRSFWNLKSGNLLLLAFSISVSGVQAQYSEPEMKFTHEEKYLYPVNPGSPGSLAGNMGELRTSHFHSGIDIRTNNQIGLPVVASKSGYVSRIGMSPVGFGNVIYITHPDGNTTVYGHLDHFVDRLADYVRKEQYRRKTFYIDLHPNKNQFPVEQGELIAISGNTGSSGGPHVHFDIRDKNNDALNPLDFGFDEIVDDMPPVVEKVALITLDPDARINDRFGRFEFYAYRNGNTYSLRTPILAHGTIGIEVLAKDKFRARDPFYGGVNFIDVKVNDRPFFRQAIEKIDISESRRIHTLMNYKTLNTTGKRFYKLYVDDGNTLPYYKTSPTRGKLSVQGKGDIQVQVKMMDSFANASTLNLTLRPTPPTAQVKSLPAAGPYPTGEILGNVLMITSRPAPGPDQKAFLYMHDSMRDSVVQIPPAYGGDGSIVYLVDLRNMLPDSVVVNDKTYVTNLRSRIPPSVEYKYYSDDLNITFPSNSLYDTLYFGASYHINPDDSAEIYVIGDKDVPLRSNISVSLKTRKFYLRSKQIGIYRVEGNRKTYLGGAFTNGRISFQTRELGQFTVLTDSVAPTIRPVAVNSTVARFRISDDLSGIDSFEATINGEWLLMHYDAKSGSLWSEKLDKSTPLKGELVLTVRDNASNTQVFRQTIQ